MATDLVALLRLAGVPEVRDERVPSVPRNFTPVGVMNHHTVTRGSALFVCKYGREDLRGPLCNINIRRDGVVFVVTDGYARDSGSGASNVLAAVKRDLVPPAPRADDTNGNPFFFDIEYDNNGVGEPYPDVQIRAGVLVNAALCRHFGWSANRCIHHREWSRRKVDMSWRGDLRGLVAAELGGNEVTNADIERLKKELVPAVADAVMERLGTANHHIVSTSGRLAQVVRGVRELLARKS